MRLKNNSRVNDYYGEENLCKKTDYSEHYFEGGQFNNSFEVITFTESDVEFSDR